MTFLATNDVRKLLQLVGEVRELGDDPTVWRRHALEGLNRLCRARAGTALEHWVPHAFEALATLPTWTFHHEPTASRGKAIYGAQNLGVGYESERARLAVQAANQDRTGNPIWPAIRAACLRPCVLTRHELVDERVWRRSVFYERMIEEGKLCELMSSFQPVPGLGVVDSVHLYRGPGEPPFTGEQAAMLALFHGEIGRTWRAAPVSKVASLPSRQAAVMRLLLRGKREKEIADELGVTHGTAHQHVVALYRRLGVSSRGELAAYAASVERHSGPKFIRTAGR